MSELLERPGVRRLMHNIYASMRRWVHINDLTEEDLVDWAQRTSEYSFVNFYLSDFIDADTFEKLLDLKYGLLR